MNKLSPKTYGFPWGNSRDPRLYFKAVTERNAVLASFDWSEAARMLAWHGGPRGTDAPAARMLWERGRMDVPPPPL
jgi:hypothetical protein